MTERFFYEKRIQGIGASPHNLSPEEVMREIERIKARGVEKKEFGLILLKPGFFSLDPNNLHPVQRLMESLINCYGLKILSTSSVTLSPEEIHKMYPSVFTDKENPPPPEVEKLRRDLEDFMSAEVLSYLVYGEDTFLKLNIIKNNIRIIIGYNKGSFEVRNAVHVPDVNNLDTDLAILFLKVRKEQKNSET